MWTEADGFVLLEDLLAALEMTLPPEVAYVERVQTVSSDGHTLAGSVFTTDRVYQAFVLTLPAGTL